MARHTTGSSVGTERLQRSRFCFQLATRSDDAELRTLLRNAPMDGSVRVTFQREPSFFEAAAVEGPDCRVLTVRDIYQDQLVGMGICSVRTRYVDGHPRPVGYLSGLRILPDYRSFGLLARGYREIREVCRQAGAECHLTTIAAGNQPALAVLTKGRPGLPRYHYLGRYYSLILPLRPSRKTFPSTHEIRPATPGDVQPLVEYLQRIGRTLDYCPRYQATDFFRADATFKNLQPDDILLAFRGNEIVGTLGAWDQVAFRQIIVEQYSWAQWLTRPIYNRWAALRGRPRFPAVGQSSHHLMAAIPIVQNADHRVFLALLDELRRRVDRTMHDALMVGAYELDPLLPILLSEAVFSYMTNVYLVSWDDDVDLGRTRNKNLYLELGCL